MYYKYKNMTLKLKTVVNPVDYDLGVIIARMQVHKLHEAQKKIN